MTESELMRLDAEIAEKVFGIRAELIHFEEGGKVLRYSSDYGPQECKIAPSPRYTEDPAASRDLREKLAKQWSVHVVTYSARQQYPERRASCRLLLSGEVIASEEADTEELAVALCAAKAYGIEVQS